MRKTGGRSGKAGLGFYYTLRSKIRFVASKTSVITVGMRRFSTINGGLRRVPRNSHIHGWLY
jgi:hypothetical protein